jgi:hypothetical protein
LLTVLFDRFSPQMDSKLWTDFLRLRCAVINSSTMPADALSADALLDPARAFVRIRVMRTHLAPLST